MILAEQTTALAIQATAIIAPVALYFFVLGLLNSRRTPQLLSARTDFFVLILLVGPVFLLPVLAWIGLSLSLSMFVIFLTAGLIWMLSRSHGSWVLYNTTAGESHKIISETLEDMGLSFARVENEYRIKESGIVVSLSDFPLLRNVSVRVNGFDATQSSEFEARLADKFSAVPSQTTSMAAALLLLSMAMLVAPMLMIAHHAPEIARIISDFWR